ncbi:Uncharacterised protein at_DN2679 [Pycnogonum litorale]
MVNKNYCENPTIIKNISNDSLDLVIIKVKNIVVASVYINHMYNMAKAVDIMCKEINNPEIDKCKIFLCGDFNHAPVSLPFGIHDLSNIVTFPTREEAYLDQIWTNVNENVLDVTKYAKVADHSFIKCNPRYTKYGQPRTWRKKYLVEINNDKLKCELQQTNWNLFTEITDLDERTITITAYINFCESLCTNRFVYYEDEVTLETTTSTIKHARRRRANAFKCGNDAEFKYWSHIVNDEIINLNQKLLLKLRKSKNSKQYWDSIKSISGQEQINRTKINDSVTPDQLNELVSRFEKNEIITMPPIFEVNTNGNMDTNDGPPTLEDNEIITLLKKATNKSSKGPDDLSSGTLKNFREVS